MPAQKAYPMPERLKPLRAAFNERPCLADDLVELLDWTPGEVGALLKGQIEPSDEDMMIIAGLLTHLQRGVHANQDSQATAAR